MLMKVHNDQNSQIGNVNLYNHFKKLFAAYPLKMNLYILYDSAIPFELHIQQKYICSPKDTPGCLKQHYL